MSDECFEVVPKNNSEAAESEVLCEAGRVPQNGGWYFVQSRNAKIEFDEKSEAYCEIKDGVSLDLAKGIASQLILSNEKPYAMLREKFAITIEILPEDILNVGNAVRVHFEDIDKYMAKLKARYGIVE